MILRISFYGFSNEVKELKDDLKWAYQNMEKLDFSNRKLKENKEILENKIKNLQRKVNQYRKYG